MTAEGWDELSAAIPELVYIELDDDANLIQKWAFVRLRDSGTGTDIMIYENGGAVEAAVTVPSDPVAAEQLLSVLQTHPIWFRAYYNEQRFETRWSPTHSEPIELREVSAAVVAVMRDGLGMELRRTRYTAGDESGFDTGPWALRHVLTAEQPTKRGAPERCTDWADFAERLEWVLRTLPSYDIVTLTAPAVENLSVIQFLQEARELETVIIMADTVIGPDLDSLDLQLRATGWQELDGKGTGFTEWWYGPFGSSAGSFDRRLDKIPQLTVDTFRTVFGVNSPQDLSIAGPASVVVDGRQAYISRELGIPCHPDRRTDTAATP